ncbi:ABC-type antimicrobial peptide transport system, permease component [Tessaracoccus bendigoensis DSM 12906]|uniref:ABC-type antimicrobial peptide transport system, permease component n=1 Tax=Tessaracoccus bendigoensis DSM 12906 TaxID=1123357 RepID=A0A1M6HA75_9ACTN|nr:ABC transporter permease [Tessaracoccus bendigoensis]SHJ19140.1 ABC-type antimicrobial peptide transport system, permease component [Tessaracoccus bendigoensis DSM 12906]
MRPTDLIATSLASLRQRPFRTLLTVLGVLIGTTSVVVMVSLGLGMTQSLLGSFENNANLREVTVYGPPPDAAERGLPTELNDTLVAQLSQYPGVQDSWPVYYVDVLAEVDSMAQYMQITAVPARVLGSLAPPLAWGQLPTAGQPGLVLGDMISQGFYNEMTGEMLEVDFQTQTLFLNFDTSSMMGPVPGEPQEGDATPPKRVIVPVSAVVAGDPNQMYGPYSSVAYSDFDAMVEMLKKAMPGKALPNQPATSDGRPKPGFVYSMVTLQAETPEDAEALMTALRADGYDAQASIEWIREAQRTAFLVQAVFGGIGFVSLLVAAIGIANTMMMSVYERTREIGIMKVIGAGLGDIRKMFLFESATIGFIGGLLGLLLSMGASSVANWVVAAQGQGLDGMVTTISVIPVWLMIAAVVFATLIGMVAGLAPAIRASRLSPLAAIRTQ